MDRVTECGEVGQPRFNYDGMIKLMRHWGEGREHWYTCRDVQEVVRANPSWRATDLEIESALEHLAHLGRLKRTLGKGPCGPKDWVYYSIHGIEGRWPNPA